MTHSMWSGYQDAPPLPPQDPADRMASVKPIPSNGVRGLIGLAGSVLIPVGAGSLWGAGAFALALGIELLVCVSIDEALERTTLLRRE